MLKKILLLTISLCCTTATLKVLPAAPFGKQLFEFFTFPSLTRRVPLPQLALTAEEAQTTQPSSSSSSSSTSSTSTMPSDSPTLPGLPAEVWSCIADFVATGEHGARDLSSLSKTCKYLKGVTQKHRDILFTEAMQLSHSPLFITPGDLTEERMRELQRYYLYTPSITIDIDPDDPKNYLPKILLLGQYFPRVGRLSFLLHKNYNPAYEPGEMWVGVELDGAINRLKKSFPHLDALDLKTKKPLRIPAGLAQLPERLVELRIQIDSEVLPSNLFEALSHLNNLRILDIHDSHLSDNHLRALSQLPFVESLRELNISGNNFSLPALNEFLGRLKNLKILRIANSQVEMRNGDLTHLGDRLLTTLVNTGISHQLEMLDLQNNRITLANPDILLANFENLANLDIRNNLISQETLKKLAESDFAKKLKNFQHDRIVE